MAFGSPFSRTFIDALPLMFPFVTPVTVVVGVLVSVAAGVTVAVVVAAASLLATVDTTGFAFSSLATLTNVVSAVETVVVVLATVVVAVIVVARLAPESLFGVAPTVLIGVIDISFVMDDCRGCTARLLIASKGFGGGCKGPCGELKDCPAEFTI